MGKKSGAGAGKVTVGRPKGFVAGRPAGGNFTFTGSAATPKGVGKMNKTPFGKGTKVNNPTPNFTTGGGAGKVKVGRKKKG